MSGSIFDELKKNDLSKKKEKIKFIFAIVTTNILVAFSSYSLFSESHSPTTSISKRVIHAHHKMIIAPLTLLVENDQNLSEVPVTLINKAKKVLVKRAYLHEEVKATGIDRASLRFKIEIPEGDIINLSADESEIMIAMPEIKTEPARKPVNQRVSKYEVNL